MTTTNGTDRHTGKTPVHLRDDTKQRLDQRGRFHESYSDVIARILNELEAYERGEPAELELRVAQE